MQEASMSDAIPVQGTCDPRFAQVKELFQHSFNSGAQIGAAVTFVLDGQSVVDLWGGHYDLARTREWERDTLVNVYSTTKGMTALCANQLIERNLLDIEAPVADVWPEFAAAGKEAITIRWLLTHRAGLCGVSTPLPKGSLYDWDRMCNALAAQSPWWQPGDGYGYHPFTYGFLVGEIVRRVTGESLGTYFRNNVARPLGADFHIGLAAENDSRTSDVYSPNIGNKPAPARNPDDPAPTTPAAFAEFARRLQDPSSMQWAALLNPPQDRDAVNTRAWRAAEIPAVNGHCTARALARIYGALARGGEIDGVRILKPETIARATTEEISGPERLFCGAVSMRLGLGFVLSDTGHRYSRLSPNPRAFGHAGGGGSLGMADPDRAIGFGFTMNNMQASMVSAGATPTVLIDAFYEALDH
jgi:CubicO group peptidase (beta-lactamase class C family)